MSLMTAAIAMLGMLTGYVSIATPLVRHMPQEYQRTAVAIPWQPIMVYVVVTFCVALVLIRVTKPPRPGDWEQGRIPTRLRIRRAGKRLPDIAPLAREPVCRRDQRFQDPRLVVACPAPGTISNVASGHALDSSHAVRAGVATS